MFESIFSQINALNEQYAELENEICSLNQLENYSTNLKICLSKTNQNTKSQLDYTEQSLFVSQYYHQKSQRLNIILSNCVLQFNTKAKIFSDQISEEVIQELLLVYQNPISHTIIRENQLLEKCFTHCVQSCLFLVQKEMKHIQLSLASMLIQSSFQTNTKCIYQFLLQYSEKFNQLMYDWRSSLYQSLLPEQNEKIASLISLLKDDFYVSDLNKLLLVNNINRSSFIHQTCSIIQEQNHFLVIQPIFILLHSVDQEFCQLTEIFQKSEMDQKYTSNMQKLTKSVINNIFELIKKYSQCILRFDIVQAIGFYSILKRSHFKTDFSNKYVLQLLEITEYQILSLEKVQIKNVLIKKQPSTFNNLQLIIKLLKEIEFPTNDLEPLMFQ